MFLKNLVVGWLLIVGMVLFALAQTVIHAGRTVLNLAGSFGSDDASSVSRNGGSFRQN
jgi:hypothetical protein